MKTLADLIKKNKELILEDWLKQVRKEIPSAKDKPEGALVDSMPHIMDDLVKFLGSPTPDNFLKQMTLDMAAEHGKQRSQLTDYTLDQVIWEYKLFADVITNVVDKEGRTTPIPVKKLWDFILSVIRDAGNEFARVREEEKSQLHEKEKKEAIFNFNTIIDGVAEYAIFTLDSKGVIETWNEGAHRMKRYTREEAIGMHFEHLYPQVARDRNEPMEHLKAARIEGRFRGEGTRVRKNGEIFVADVFIIPIKRDNEVVGFCKIVQDLSERNQLIQERDLSRIELDNLKVEKDLRETFVQTLTHDLRGPLTAAKMSAELIIRNPADQDRNLRFMYKIIEHIDRTDKMIWNLLDANKIRAGENLKLHISECNMLSITNDVVEDLSTTHGHKIIVKGSELIGFWDFEAIRRVIENLVSNAIKYGDPTKPVTVSFEPNSEDMVSLKIHNYGNPIEVSDHNLLFQKFHRANTAREGKKGWGLGLTLVKGLVEAHHGGIKVESYPIEGTTFTIDLPIDGSKKPKTEGGSPEKH